MNFGTWFKIFHHNDQPERPHRHRDDDGRPPPMPLPQADVAGASWDKMIFRMTRIPANFGLEALAQQIARIFELKHEEFSLASDAADENRTSVEDCHSIISRQTQSLAIYRHPIRLLAVRSTVCVRIKLSKVTSTSTRTLTTLHLCHQSKMMKSTQ